jgi:hypothetical protein
MANGPRANALAPLALRDRGLSATAHQAVAQCVITHSTLAYSAWQKCAASARHNKLCSRKLVSLLHE